IPLDHLRLEKGTSLKLGTFKYGDISLTDTPIYLVGDVNKSKDNWEFDGGLRSDRLSLMQQSQTFRVKDIAAHLTIDAEALTINGGFSPDPLPGKFDFSIRHSLNTASGQLRVRQKDPVDLTADNDKLSQLLTPWPYPFDLLTGSISLESDASWSKNKSFSLSVEMKLDEGGGHIDELLFSGLSFEHRLLILPVLSSTQPGEVRLAHIDSGVDVDNIGMDLAIHSPGTDARPELVVTNLHGEILNGSFGSDRLIYDLNRSNNAFRITATDIDLAEIVKTQQLNDIEVTGKISGSIPVEINKKGLSIKNGSFINSIKNGTIRYDPATGTEQLKQNPLTGVALEALKDFRYTYLSAGVNFDPDGTLAVNLQLKGVSPELDTDRPVHLNINTEQDLLSLLKSLRYAQGISEKIDSRVRRQYEKTH
ncbi:MAG TPA: hypothetical protein ENJ87_01155, partial [Gammaproteobacteria bacterium]|nr:hypothetical protein [Gammaproteobacteria bacterium]